MSTRLVILGLLRQRPLYGYEIKSIIEDHMGDWTNIAFGSIYFALGKLSEEGFIEKVATEKAGNRPSRSVYQITEAGRDEFSRLLRQAWMEFDRQFFPFDIGLFFMNALAKDEIIGYLQNRLVQLEMVLRHLDEHQSEETGKDEAPALASAIFDHTRMHTQAELAWTRDVLAKVEAGEYP
ncbi:MAG: PadR family transcriptional regulator [Anaerolineales bacterium]|nr:PadR family transcriptional regulator [Anaerolineales bacterium]